MPQKKHRPEEIGAKLRLVDMLVSQGQSAAEAVRPIGVTQFPCYWWRKEFGGLKTDQVKRLKELENENARLRKAVSDPPREAGPLAPGPCGHLVAGYVIRSRFAGHASRRAQTRHAPRPKPDHLMRAGQSRASASRTGQSGTSAPVHCAAVLASADSILRRSAIFARTSARCRSVRAWTSAQVGAVLSSSPSSPRMSSIGKPSSRARKMKRKRLAWAGE